MITKEDIDRINFLSRKSKEQGLTEIEKVEQQDLRRKYIDYIKGQVKMQLDNIEYVEEKNSECECGCEHEHEHHHHDHKHGKN